MNGVLQLEDAFYANFSFAWSLWNICVRAMNVAREKGHLCDARLWQQTGPYVT